MAHDPQSKEYQNLCLCVFPSGRICNFERLEGKNHCRFHDPDKKTITFTEAYNDYKQYDRLIDIPTEKSQKYIELGVAEDMSDFIDRLGESIDYLLSEYRTAIMRGDVDLIKDSFRTGEKKAVRSLLVNNYFTNKEKTYMRYILDNMKEGGEDLGII